MAEINGSTLQTGSLAGMDLEKSPNNIDKTRNEPFEANPPDDILPTARIERHPSPVDTNEPKRQIIGFRWFLICIAIFSANVLYGLDTTIAADIQAFVSDTFNNVTQLGWLGVGFTLGSTVAILPLGKAYGIFDAKWIFVGCLTMFAAASALCGGAPNMNAVIVGRVWAGAGGAGMYLG